MAFSKEFLEDYHRRTGLGANALEAVGSAIELSPIDKPGKGKANSAGSTPKGEMNKTEGLFYLERLLPLQAAGEIGKIRYEKEKFRIGIPASFYEPDFTAPIINPNRTAQRLIIEIKGGFIRDKSLTKFKAAAMEFREYNFQLWQYKIAEGWKLIHNLNEGETRAGK